MVDFFGTSKAFKPECRARIRPQRRALHVPQMGPARLRQFPRRAAGHRHLPSGQSRISGPQRVDARRTTTDGKTVETAFPDTLVGTDSHTTMVNGLAVLGWGVGGIEAEAAMLGQPISMLIPEVIGFRLDRQAAGRHDRHRPRAHRHRDAAQEGRGRKVRRILRPGPRRICRSRTGRPSPTWRPNMARPAASSRSAAETLRLYEGHRPRGRSRIALVEAYAKAQGMFWHRDNRPSRSSPTRSRSILPRSSPRWPARSVRRTGCALSDAAPGFAKVMAERVQEGATSCAAASRSTGANFDLGHGDVVIAAITSCTNTSNPSVMIGAGLLAAQRRARRASRSSPGSRPRWRPAARW